MLRKIHERPAVGTKMYSVHEHLYYIKGYPAPIREYCVCEAKVIGFFQGGYTEIRLSGLSPEGYRTPYYYKLSEIGERLFYTAQEAARLAKQETEQYEHVWGWLGAPNIPMRRPWERLLTDSGF